MSLFQDLLKKSQLVPDQRAQEWPLMKFEQAFGITLAYVIFVLVEKKLQILPKMDLKFVRIIHNFSMTIINFYLVVELLRQAAATSWYGPIDRSDRGTGMAAALWIFYVSKILEFNDTLIMLFRKTYNQVSFLHWYHHASVFMMWWFNVRYYPGGEAYPSAWLNSFVHVWMYSYYLFSTLGYTAWWKKYLTQLQISQLTLFVVQGISLLFTGAEEFRFIGMINGLYALTILSLFIKFYIESYKKPREREGEQKSSGDTTSPRKSRKTRKDD